MHRRWVNGGGPRVAAALIVALCLMITAGCQSSFGPSFTPPQVAVEGFDLRRPGLFSQEVTVTLLVQNRMQQALTIEAVDLELEVNGTRLGTGALLKTIPLAAAGAAAADVPVKVKTQDILDAFFALAREPRLAYEISGHVRLTGGGADGTGHEIVPFDDDGEFTLPIGPRGLEVMNGDARPAIPPSPPSLPRSPA